MGAGGTSTDNGVTAGMDAVQRDAYRIFNTPEAYNSENGVSLDQVSSAPFSVAGQQAQLQHYGPYQHHSSRV